MLLDLVVLVLFVFQLESKSLFFDVNLFFNLAEPVIGSQSIISTSNQS